MFSSKTYKNIFQIALISSTTINLKTHTSPNIERFTLPKTNSSLLKMVVSKFGISFSGHHFQGPCLLVSGRVNNTCAMVKSRYIGDGHPTFNRNPYNGYIKSYYWVDDHSLLYGNKGSLDPGTHDTCRSKAPMPPPTCSFRSSSMVHPLDANLSMRPG